MNLPSCGTALKRIGVEPDARIDVLRRAASSARRPAPVTSTLFPGSSRPCPWMPTTPAALNSEPDARGHGLDDGRAALLHLREIELDVAELDAVDRELLLRALK